MFLDTKSPRLHIVFDLNKVAFLHIFCCLGTLLFLLSLAAAPTSPYQPKGGVTYTITGCAFCTLKKNDKIGKTQIKQEMQVQMQGKY